MTPTPMATDSGVSVSDLLTLLSLLLASLSIMALAERPSIVAWLNDGRMAAL